MKRLITIELRKLATTPALYFCAAITLGLTVMSVFATILLAGKAGSPAVGSVDNVSKVFAVGALTSMVALALGIMMVAGEYRHRVIIGTYLAEPRRARVIAAKFLTAAGLGAFVGAASFGTALGIAAPLYASKGVHHLPVDLTKLGIGTTIVSACYGMLGVALGALARNTVGAIIGAFVWIQVIEVGVLQPALPSLAKWLPTGAAVALTSVGTSAQHLLSTGPAALTLIAWAVLLTAIAAKTSITRELT